MTTQTSDSDDGTTLVELLVVTVIMGIVATVLAFSFVAVVKASPSTEARTDDARTLLGLTTYLPEDVNSTPSTGYDLAKAAVTGCSGASPGVSLVHLTWTETTGSTTTFRVNYRYVDDGNGYKIVRYSCLGGGAPNQLRMTSQLPDINELTWIPGSTPVNVQTTTNGTEITGLTVQVTTIAGDALTLEMRTNNPADTLPPTPPIIFPPPPPGNVAPTAGDVSSTTFPNTPVDVALDGDDVDGDVLVATWSNVTPNWSVSVTGLTATVTPDPLAIEPTVGTFNYTVRDPYGQTSASALVTVTLVAAPINGPPDAPDVVASIEEGTRPTLPTSAAPSTHT